MMPQDHGIGEPWWAATGGVNLCVVVLDIGGWLRVCGLSGLCAGWVACVQGKARLP